MVQLRSVRTAVAASVVLLLGSSCGDGGDPAPSPSPTVAPSPSPTPAPASPSPTIAAVDPAVVPDGGDITVAYAQAVVDALDDELGELARLAVAEGVESEAVAAGLSEIYAGEALATATEGWRDYLAPRFGDAPEGPETTVTELLTASRDCISVRADRSLDPYGPEVEFSGSGWHLAFEPSDRPPGEGNPTAWRMTYEGFPADDSVELEDPCAGGAG